VTFLRRVLRWQSIFWALFGVALLVAPSALVEGLFDQGPVAEDAWLRTLGVASIVLAAQMVLVARKLDELWWWTWSFVLLEAGTAVVFLLNALVGVPEGAATWPWWTLAIANLAVGGAAVVGLARAGTERSPT
jgi:hypothetical protein